MTARRLPLLVLIPAVLVALGLATRSHRADLAAPVATRGGSSLAALQPTAAPASALSSTFYCAGGSATSGDQFEATVVVANPTSVALSGQVTVYAGALDTDAAGQQAVASLQPAVRPLNVAAHARAEFRLGEAQASPFAAALVEIYGGQVAVERRTYGPRGLSVSACATAPSSSWYLPSGSTTKDARELLALFNPTPDSAIVDLAFITSDGFRAPPPYQGLVVPPRHVSVIDIAAAVGRHDEVATEVLSRSGRVVVDRLQSFDGSDANHPAGAAVTLAAPQPTTAWTFPEGLVTNGLNEVYTVLNPGDAPAAVELAIALDDPATNGEVDPIAVDVPARSYVQVAMRDQTRVPPGIGHAVIVRSTNDVPVVPERVISAAAPATRLGYAPAFGSPVTATKWLFAEGRADATEAEFVTLDNSSTQTAHVRFTALAQGQPLAVEGLQAVEVPAGQRVAVELGQHINRADLPLLVESDVPVVAERGLYAASGIGLSLAIGVPLAEGLAPPPAPPPTTTTEPTTLPPVPTESS